VGARADDLPQRPRYTTRMPTLQTSPPNVSSAVVDYPARDMTITVGAAMEIGTLRRILQQENQQLPIDVAEDSATLGQLVADDVCGPRQFGYGSLRDYVIGIEAIDGRGRVFHAGGRVVKNVAGYDLCRLLVGSRNELGTITRITFKLKPIPSHTTLLAAGFRSPRDLESALQRLNISATCPQILDVVGRLAYSELLRDAIPELAGSDACSETVALLLIGFEGPEAACAWQSKTLQDELRGTATCMHEATNSGATLSWCRTAQKAAKPSPNLAWMAKLTTLPSRVVAAVSSLQDAGCSVFGRAGNGVLFVRPGADSAEARTPIDEQSAMNLLHSLVSDGVGSVDVLKSVAGRSTPALSEVRRISEKLRGLLGS
jgi:glycolate oxidase FAD binding subunit